MKESKKEELTRLVNEVKEQMKEVEVDTAYGKGLPLMWLNVHNLCGFIEDEILVNKG